MAWLTFHNWLMSHIISMSGPTLSRITRIRSTSRADVDSAPIWVFICLKPILTSRGPASAKYSRFIGRISAPLA